MDRTIYRKWIRVFGIRLYFRGIVPRKIKGSYAPRKEDVMSTAARADAAAPDDEHDPEEGGICWGWREIAESNERDLRWYRKDTSHLRGEVEYEERIAAWATLIARQWREINIAEGDDPAPEEEVVAAILRSTDPERVGVVVLAEPEEAGVEYD